MKKPSLFRFSVGCLLAGCIASLVLFGAGIMANAAPVGLVPTYQSTVVPVTIDSILPPYCNANGGEVLQIKSSAGGLFTGTQLLVQGASPSPITPVFGTNGQAGTAICPAYVPLDGGIAIQGTSGVPVPTSVQWAGGISNWPSSFASGVGLTYTDSTIPPIIETAGGVWIINPINGGVLQWTNVAPGSENSPADQGQTWPIATEPVPAGK